MPMRSESGNWRAVYGGLRLPWIPCWKSSIESKNPRPDRKNAAIYNRSNLLRSLYIQKSPFMHSKSSGRKFARLGVANDTPALDGAPPSI